MGSSLTDSQTNDFRLDRLFGAPPHIPSNYETSGLLRALVRRTGSLARRPAPQGIPNKRPGAPREPAVWRAAEGTWSRRRRRRRGAGGGSVGRRQISMGGPSNVGRPAHQILMWGHQIFDGSLPPIDGIHQIAHRYFARGVACGPIVDGLQHLPPRSTRRLVAPTRARIAPSMTAVTPAVFSLAGYASDGPSAWRARRPVTSRGDRS